ncbi:MAG: tRNA (5-methylaminomethyl-2-thiouridine)(34)-methyltransferase MnmD [Bacteroidales bacterium]|nr:tRNA (5-methylaminomethyl-2-thiouridine)(34)-methyltransferase MnmD [Bacteroidales bacterium]
MKYQLILTEDGSHTIYMEELNEHYHSVYGALQESRHVFINAGLKACNSQQVNILEIGFGTGLNALLTFFEAEARNQQIHYTACEPFPVTEMMWKQLNYATLFTEENASTIFDSMHATEFGREVQMNGNFTFQKIAQKIENANLLENHFHLIYFDAFAPAVQPELWTYQIFKKLFDATDNDGVLVTYSAMGEVRRSMTKAGFKVERLPGPPGKREMLRAMKKSYHYGSL